jgi:hypothetical protein
MECSVNGCDRTSDNYRIINSKQFGRLLCNRHYFQLSQIGVIRERTIFDKNRIVIKNDICEMELYDNKCNVNGTVIFNKRHLNKLKDIKWRLNNSGYARASVTNILMHTVIMEPMDGLEIDHKDRNKLNNLDDNLRYATQWQNGANKKCRGYFWDKDRNKWCVVINVNKKRHIIGFFLDEEIARVERRKAEIFYLGEFSPN